MVHWLFQVKKKYQVLQTEETTQKWKGISVSIMLWVGLVSVWLQADTQSLWSRSHMADSCIEKEREIHCFELSSAVITTHKATFPVDPTSSIAFLGPQTQDYGTGFLINYAWQAWFKTFELQTSTDYKVCTSIYTNKEADSGVLRQGSKWIAYTITWHQQYTCHRGGSPRYEVSQENVKTRSRLTRCKATLNM